jgi:3',5'-cyclic AMP phosphodiesterase CpdA
VFLDGCLASVPVAAALAGMANAAEPADRVSFEVKNPARFRILQLTDLHYVTDRPEVSKEKTNALIRELLEKTQPDLVMITGDLWADNEGGLGVQQMHEAIAEFDSWGLPWAYTWGNHDKLDDFSVGHKAFAEGKNSLYRGVETNGNYAIDLATADGKRIAQLVCLNTTTKGLGDEQRAWLHGLALADGEAIPRLAFFHIPLKQYADIWDSEVASGIKGEAVCLEEENGSSLAALKEAGVRACFCGHDHVNDYSGVADGIELVYGRATGGYGADRVDKGGKVIDFNCETGEYQWYSVTRKEAEWHPQPGSRVEVPKKD